MLDSTNHQRPRRKRSQSCSSETMSPALEAHNSTQTLENSVNKTFTVEKQYSFNKTFTFEAEEASYSKASNTPKDANCHSNEEKLVMAPKESRQDVLPVESNEAVIVKSIKLNASEGLPEPHKSESDSLCASQKRESQHTPLPSVKSVLNETKIGATESSCNTPSQSSTNKEMLNALTLPEGNSSPSSDTTLTEPFNEPSSPCKIDSDDASQAELPGLSKDEVPSKVVEDTAPESCTSHNEGKTASNKPAILSSENSCKSQDCEILIKGHNSLPEKRNQKSSSHIKGIENGQPHLETVRIEDLDTGDNAVPAQDVENETEHEEIRREIHQSEKFIDSDLNKELDEKNYEGEKVQVLSTLGIEEEVEVLSTSGIEEEDEGQTVGMTPEALDDNEVEARKVDCLISRKSLRSHIRQLCLTKDGKDVNSDSGSKEVKHAHIPVVKVQCLSEVALTKEVLISPDVSDEECELVSPGADFTDAKFPIEVDNLEDTAPPKNVSCCFSNLNLQKNNGGINSPHKTIPEEQDESTIPKRSSERISKASALKRSKNLTPHSSIPSPEKLDDRNVCTRRSSRGGTSEGFSGLPQNLEISKLPKAFSSTQEEHTVSSNPECILDTSNKSATETKGQKKKETVTDTPKNSRSLAGSHDSVSLSSHGNDKESKGKKLQTNSPNSAGSTEKELNASRNASQERILLSPQDKNSELSGEDSDDKHNLERCKVIKSQLTESSVPGTSGEETILRQDRETEESHFSSCTGKESSVCDTPCQSGTGFHKCLSSSSSQAQPPVRRSSRLRKQPSDLSFLSKDSRSTDSSGALSEGKPETEEADHKSTPGSPKNLRRSMRSSGTSQAPRDAKLLTG